MIVTEIIGGILAILAVVIPVILKIVQSRKANRNDLGKVESAELLAGMDAVDRRDDERVQPVQKHD